MEVASLKLHVGSYLVKHTPWNLHSGTTPLKLPHGNYTMEVTSCNLHHGSYLVEPTPWNLLH